MKKIVLLSVAMALSANAEYLPLASPPLSIVADKGAAVELVPRGEDACDVFVTSGRRWEQTRKYGVNALGMRACQNGTFFQADPDCAGLVAAGAIAWANNAAWIEAVSLSGQSFFLSWRASLMDDAVRAVLRGAFAAASRPRPNGEPLDWEANPFPATWRFAEGTRTFDWTDRTARAE